MLEFHFLDEHNIGIELNSYLYVTGFEFQVILN